jgi:hypothetical protein
MSKKLLPLLVLPLLFYMQCRNNDSQNEITITRNHRSSVNIRDIFEEYRFVYLQTTDSTLVGMPQKILHAGERIYISDGNALFQYSLQGDFFGALRRQGRGPGEYSQISDFAVKDNAILVLDRNQKTLIEYDLLNNHVDTYPLGLYIASFEVLDECKVLLHVAYQSESDEKLVEYDLCTKSFGNRFWPIHPSHNTYRHFMGQQNFYRHAGKLLFHEPMNNNIYQITENEAQIRYNLNLFGKNPPESFWDAEYVDVLDIMTRLKESGYSYGTPVYAESDNQILFTYKEPAGYVMCLYEKGDGTSIQFDAITISSDDSVSVKVAGLNVMATDSENIIFSISGDKFYNENDELLSAEFSEAQIYGNPVICIASLK